MNNPLPYEQLIAQKLEQLPPLQGMQDMIWQRITATLDSDFPEDTPPQEPKAGPSGGPGGLPGINWWWGGLGLGILGLVFWLAREVSPLPESPGRQPATLERSAPELNPVQPGTPLLKPSATMPAQAVKPAPAADGVDSGISPSISDVAPVLQDSLPSVASSSAESGIGNPPPKDSQAVVPQPPFNPQPQPQTQSQTPSQAQPKAPPGKKPPGVRGIQSSDYKLVPKKDSIP